MMRHIHIHTSVMNANAGISNSVHAAVVVRMAAPAKSRYLGKRLADLSATGRRVDAFGGDGTAETRRRERWVGVSRRSTSPLETLKRSSQEPRPMFPTQVAQLPAANAAALAITQAVGC